MKFEVRMKQLSSGAFQARYIGGKVETITVNADTRDEVLAKMKDHIRYHLEYCP